MSIEAMDKIMSLRVPSEPVNTNGYENRNPGSFNLLDLDFNLTAAPYNYDTAVIVTSYYAQLGWLKASLKSYRDANAFVILSYDNSMYPWDRIEDPLYSIRMLPRPIHYFLAHTVVMKHKTYDADKRTGWFWDVWYAAQIIRSLPNIKYVYVTNGDCLIEKPEGLAQLPSVLDDGDLMSGQSTPGGTIHTANLYFKISAFNRTVEYMANRMKWPVLGSQSPESLLRDAVDELRLHETFVDQPILEDGSIDYYCTRNLKSTWKDVLGFHNLYGETECRENNGLEPLSSDYFDPFHNWIYFRDGWKATLCKYYETKDRRYLMQWWDQGKDSDYDRKYLPLEAYGKEPVWE